MHASRPVAAAARAGRPGGARRAYARRSGDSVRRARSRAVPEARRLGRAQRRVRRRLRRARATARRGARGAPGRRALAASRARLQRDARLVHRARRDDRDGAAGRSGRSSRTSGSSCSRCGRDPANERVPPDVDRRAGARVGRRRAVGRLGARDRRARRRLRPVLRRGTTASGSSRTASAATGGAAVTRPRRRARVVRHGFDGARPREDRRGRRSRQSGVGPRAREVRLRTCRRAGGREAALRRHAISSSPSAIRSGPARAGGT